jgi:hypothetical protein
VVERATEDPGDLVVIMIVRPQGLLGTRELGPALFRRRRTSSG